MSLRDSKLSSFNRESARAALLNRLGGSTTARSSATGQKLLDTLTALSKNMGSSSADKENAGAKSSMRQGARRVPAKGGVPATPASKDAASTAVDQAKMQAIEAEKEKLKKKVAEMKAQMEKAGNATESEKQLETLRAEKQQLEASLAEARQQLQERDATIARQSAELEEARAQIARLQQEKESLIVHVNGNGSTDTEMDSSAAPADQKEQDADEEDEIVLKDLTTQDSTQEEQDEQISSTSEDVTAALPPIQKKEEVKEAAAPKQVASEQESAESASEQDEEEEADDESDDEVVFGAAHASESETEEDAAVATPDSPTAAIVINASTQQKQEELDLSEEITAPITLTPAVPMDTPLQAKEEEKEDLATPVQKAADISAAAAEEDFSPVTAEDMEASLGHIDSFSLASPTALKQQDTSSSSAASDNNSPANESSASINLSLNSSTLSPLRRGQLPASFLSNPSSPSSPILSSTTGLQSFLSPISSPTSSPFLNSSDSDSSSKIPSGKFLASSTSNASNTASLSKSALKIQALFRGRMERSYLNKHEVRLAQLPLTSPSTPLRAGFAASPCAKRARVSVSPIAISGGEKKSNCSMLIEEEEENVQKNLSFNMEEAEEEEEAPLPLAAPLSPSSQKRISSELKSARQVLQSMDNCWTLRSKAMNRIEQAVREQGVEGMAGWAGWPQELHHLQKGLTVQLNDLRSSILREACRLLIALSEASKRDFEDQLAYYAPLLWKSLYVTIKIISTSCDDTLREVVARVATVKSIPLFLSGLSDTHAVVREKCGSYLLQIVSVARPSDLESHLPALLQAAKTTLQDSDQKARAAWRALFEGIRKKFPTEADKFYLELPSSVQKAIENDRKMAKKAANTKRKK